METSSYFRKVMFWDQNPVAAEYFEERSPSLFVNDPSLSWVEVGYFGIPEYNYGFCFSESTQSLPLDNQQEIDTKRSSGFSAEAQSEGHIPDFRDLKEDGLRLHVVSHEDKLRRFVLEISGGSRIFIIRQRNSFSRLSITRALFECLIRECVMFPQFKEFILCFGTKSGENEVGPPQLRFRAIQVQSPAETRVLLECAYVLRFVELNHRAESSPWSLRQSAVYHKFDGNSKASTWVFVALSQRARARLDSYVRSNARSPLLNPFEVHVLLLDTAMANWRPYLVYLASEANAQADRVIAASIGEEGLVRITEFDERQALKQFEDTLLDLNIILNSTLDTISLLLDNYQDPTTQAAIRLEPLSAEVKDPVILGLRERRGDVLLHLTKVETLRCKVQGTTQLLSSLLDFGNGYSLKQLAEEAKKENATMRELTMKGFRDGVAIKVLTIVTLVYLPATVVSNFFSTQFVTQGEGRLHLTSNWWIFVAITVPLTIVTLYVWWFYVKKQAYGFYPSWYEMLRRAARRWLARGRVRHSSTHEY